MYGTNLDQVGPNMAKLDLLGQVGRHFAVLCLLGKAPLTNLDQVGPVLFPTVSRALLICGCHGFFFFFSALSLVSKIAWWGGGLPCAGVWSKVCSLARKFGFSWASKGGAWDRGAHQGAKLENPNLLKSKDRNLLK